MKPARSCRTFPVGVLPDDRAAHSKTNAHCGYAVLDIWMFTERAGELRHQPHPRRRQRVPESDRPAVGVDPRVVILDAEVVQEGENLYGESLVELEQADVVDGKAAAFEGAFG